MAEVTIATQHGNQPLRHVVQHECGHAAVSWALGVPFARIVVDSQLGPHVEPDASIGSILAGLDWIIRASGFIADYQSRGYKMRGSQIVRMVLGGDNDRFEVDDATTGAVAVRPSRLPAVQPGMNGRPAGDLHGMAAEFGTRPRAEATPEVIRFWRACEAYTAELRPAIDALAEAVLDCGELAYGEAAEVAAAAMSGHPMPVVADWLRAELGMP